MDERARKWERRLEWPMLFFAVLVIPAIILQESDADSAQAIGKGLDWFIWLAFLGEAVLMLRVVPKRREWLRDHPLEVAIIVLTPPFMPGSLQALRAFRLLRLLRLLRLFVIVRRLLSTEGTLTTAPVRQAPPLQRGVAAAGRTPDSPGATSACDVGSTASAAATASTTATATTATGAD